jgi:hypothetical protein
MVDFEWLVEGGTRPIPTLASKSRITTLLRTKYSATTHSKLGLLPLVTLPLKIQEKRRKIAPAG